MQINDIRKSKAFVSKRTRTMALLISIVLPCLLLAFSYFMNARPMLNTKDEWSILDFFVQNADLIFAVVFLAVSAVPFYLVFDKKRAQARDLVPIALMSALSIVGRAAFAIVPLPNFKPVTAIVIITAVAFGPEAGYLTGALTGFLSNFLFGQGPWTPWQMFTWGMIGFLAGLFYKTGVFGNVGQEKADEFGKRKHPKRLCIFGFLGGFFYGWIMNLYHLIGYVNPITWQSFFATYASSIFYDMSHGICTALVLWFAAEPWVRKLLRVKKKFGLDGENVFYVMPPSNVTVRNDEN